MIKVYLFLLIILLFDQTYPQSDDKFSYKNDFKKILEYSKTKDHQLYYPTLLNRFMKNDTTLTNNEIIAMLIGYTENDNYKPYEQMEIERKIFSLNVKKNYLKTIELSDSLLGKYPFSLLGNREKSFACYKLGKIEEQNLYFDRFTRITNAILWSGDGVSPETSLFVLGPADGQTIIKFVLFCEIGEMGSGYSNEKYFTDILEMKQESGEKVKLYFNIDHAIKKSSISKELKEINK